MIQIKLEVNKGQIDNNVVVRSAITSRHLRQWLTDTQVLIMTINTPKNEILTNN